jgi:drug/metabolite transporter (DMT)-like permease
VIALIGTILFSTKAIWIKLCYQGAAIDATTLLMLRMLIAFPFYVFTFWYSSQKSILPITKRHWQWAIAMGLLGYYMSSLFDFVGLQYISAGIERIILFVYPTLAVIINRVIFKTKITQKQWMSIGVTYLGIAIAYWGELKQINNSAHFIYGSVMVLLCGITYAFYLVGTGKLVSAMGAARYTSSAMLAASLGIFIHFLIQTNFRTNPMMAGIPHSILGYILALGLIATVIPSFLLNWGMKRVGSNNLAIITSIGPVATLFQAHYILGEPLTFLQLTGTTLVLLGVLLIKKVGATKTDPDYPDYPSPKG